jgi:hypothetical protein
MKDNRLSNLTTLCHQKASFDEKFIHIALMRIMYDCPITRCIAYNVFVKYVGRNGEVVTEKSLILIQNACFFF